MENEQATIDPHKRTLDVFEQLIFFPEDLAANRNGRLSDSQRNSLMTVGNAVKPGITLIGGFSLIGIVGFSLIFAVTSDIIFTAVICGFGAILFVAGAIFAGRFYLALERAAEAGEVSSTSGPVNFMTQRGDDRSQATLTLVCGGRSFHTNNRHAQEIWRSRFTTGESYTIFYLPVGVGSDLILSFEPLEQAEND